MKIYNLDTEFTFGKYQYKTIRQVIEIDFLYINWCVTNLEHFYIGSNVVNELQQINPDFKLTEVEQKILEDKHADWIQYLDEQAEWSNAFDERSRAILGDNYNDELDMDQQSQDFWEDL